MIRTYHCVLEATEERWAVQKVELTIRTESLEEAKEIVESTVPGASRSKRFRWLKLEEIKT